MRCCRGLEGWVRCQVHHQSRRHGGSNPVVVDADPRRVFDREATRAILRWKFRPRIVDGEAVSREAEQVIEFKLEQGAQ
jgi:periplasmic protein TonB